MIKHCLFTIAILLHTLIALASGPPKILIIYSSIGMGHISASRAIEERLKQQNPEAIIELKDIRSFMPARAEALDRKLYLFVFNNMPKILNSQYQKAMTNGLATPDFDDLNTGYNEHDLLRYIEDLKPDTVIATHYGSAMSLAHLRNQGKLAKVKIGWVHTDYVKQYFPRISNRIDKTFVGHDDLSKAWKDFGVAESKVETSGIPVRSLPQISAGDKEQTLRAVDLKPDVLTFVMSGGGEGLKDNPSVVLSLAETFTEPIQIVAICGKNEKAKLELDRLASKLPPHVKLKALGFIPNKQLTDLVSASDVYITKAGGLSPTEGSLSLRPLILISDIGAHEEENAQFFRESAMAEVVPSSQAVGAKAKSLLANPERVKQMVELQREFRNSLNIDSITNWALQEQPAQKQMQVDLGLKNGTTIDGAQHAIARLSRDFPGNVEVLLSYPKSKTGTYFGDGKESNPFGHIAIRINDTVYTINHLAIRGEEPHLIHKSNLEEYLYTTKSYYKNEEFTGMHGQAYAKDTVSLRLNEVSEGAVARMLSELALIDRSWQDGTLDYNTSKFNCADMVLRTLVSGNLVNGKSLATRKIKLPLDVFDASVKSSENLPDLQSSVVHYSYVQGSKNEYRTTGFPLSFYQLKRALLNILRKGRDKFERTVDARIFFTKDSSTAKYENLSSVRTEPLKFPPTSAPKVSSPLCRMALAQ